MSAPALDTDAIYAEGRQCLAAGDTLRGMEKLREAAHAGHGEASHHIAMILGTDPSTPDQWDYVLAYVGRAAKAGHRRAQASLAFLAGDAQALAAIERGENLPEENWYRLHGMIKPDDWLTRPVQTVVREAPRIATIERLITPGMCDWIVAQARPGLKRAMVYDVRDGSGVESKQRTNSDMRFSFPDTDLVLIFTGRIICDMLGCHFLDQEDPSVLHYTPGQEFKAHFDYLNPAIPAYAKSIPVQGQRIWTLLIYLNEDFAGGETAFPRLGYAYKGRKGDALLFRNVDTNGKPDPMTLHAGMAPTSGEKWLFSQWIRQAPAGMPPIQR